MGAVGQQLVADDSIEDDAQHQHGNAHRCIHEEAGGNAHFLQGIHAHQVAGCADDGQVAAQSGSEDQGHQQAGAGVAGLIGNAADHGDQHGGGAGVGQEAGHNANDGHNGHDQHSLGLGELGDQAADLVGHAGLKQGLAHNEHAHAQDDVAVDIACEGIGVAQNTGQVQADGHDGSGQAKGNLFKNEAHNGEGQEEQCNGTGRHLCFLLLNSFSFAYAHCRRTGR